MAKLRRRLAYYWSVLLRGFKLGGVVVGLITFAIGGSALTLAGFLIHWDHPVLAGVVVAVFSAGVVLEAAYQVHDKTTSEASAAQSGRALDQMLSYATEYAKTQHVEIHAKYIDPSGGRAELEMRPQAGTVSVAGLKAPGPIPSERSEVAE